jgi:transcriptional regulator with XRE-family HTH domain
MQASTINFQLWPYNAAMPGGRPTNKPAPKFGQRLAALRVERGLSQTALAAELGTTRNAILHYERSAKNPSAEFVEKVAKFFGVGFDDLLGGDTKAARKPGPTPQIAQLTERLSKLPRAQQKMVTAMLEAALQKAG